MKRTSTTTRIALLSAFVMVALTGCGASEVIETAEAAAAGEGGTEYPLTLENCGREITIESAPQRVASLDQNSTEILLSLGLEDRIVGTASWTDPVLPSLADANDDVPRLADNAPTYEVLLGADPEFVTSSFGRHFNEEGGVASRDRLEETGIGSYLSPTDCEDGVSINGGGTRTRPLTVDALHQEISELAAIFDVSDRGAELIAELDARAERALDGIDLEGASVAFWFADTKTPYIAGGFGAPSVLSSLTGMENVFSDIDDDWPATGWETFVDAEPQILVLGDLQRDRFPGDRLDDKIAFLESDPLTSTMRAVRGGCYVALHGAEMNPSIRYVDGLEKIREWAEDADECVSTAP